MVKFTILIASIMIAGMTAAIAQGEPGYPIPAPPAMFYDTSTTADASGVTLLSIYFEDDGGAMWETEPLVSYMIFPSNEGSTAPGFTFNVAKPIEKDYQVRFTALSVIVGDIVLPFDYADSDLYEGGLTTANVIKDGGKAVFIPTKVTLPDVVSLEMLYEAEYMGDSVYLEDSEERRERSAPSVETGLPAFDPLIGAGYLAYPYTDATGDIRLVITYAVDLGSDDAYGPAFAELTIPEKVWR